MTAPSSIDPSAFLSEQLAQASPDLLRQMLFDDRVARWVLSAVTVSMVLGSLVVKKAWKRHVSKPRSCPEAGVAVLPFPSSRRLVTAAVRAGRRIVPKHGLIGVDVSTARRLLAESDPPRSMAAFVLASLGRAAAAYTELHATGPGAGSWSSTATSTCCSTVAAVTGRCTHLLRQFARRTRHRPGLLASGRRCPSSGRRAAVAHVSTASSEQPGLPGRSVRRSSGRDGIERGLQEQRPRRRGR